MMIKLPCNTKILIQGQLHAYIFFLRNFPSAYVILEYITFTIPQSWLWLWCWEGLSARGEGDDRGWDGWMASLTGWTQILVNSGSWWWTGRPGVLRFMRSQRVGHGWDTELNWTEVSVDFPGGSVVKNLLAMLKTWVQFLGWEDPLEEGMATHSNTLEWRILWAEEPGSYRP